ncbi:hypothetical protein DENSPDRAFT_845143 [Dentipellis sp. KUC8613]|nr:hypothetical protein DENSPDRAFT_845143 [Dentipellis sp. KUC8613]
MSRRARVVAACFRIFAFGSSRMHMYYACHRTSARCPTHDSKLEQLGSVVCFILGYSTPRILALRMVVPRQRTEDHV